MVSVEKVFLYNRWDGGYERTKNIQIRISNELPANGKTMFSGGSALGSYKGPAYSGEILILPSGPLWRQKDGRYLVIQMDMGKGGNYLNLQEVEVFGTSHWATGQLESGEKKPA